MVRCLYSWKRRLDATEFMVLGVLADSPDSAEKVPLVVSQPEERGSSCSRVMMVLLLAV